MSRDGSMTLSDVRGPTLAIVCEAYGRRGHYRVERLLSGWPVERVDLRRRRDRAAGDAEQGARLHRIDPALIDLRLVSQGSDLARGEPPHFVRGVKPRKQAIWRRLQMAKLAGVELAANGSVDRDRRSPQVAGQFIGPLLAELFRAPGARIFT
jgi:hypothetical protein